MITGVEILFTKQSCATEMPPSLGRGKGQLCAAQEQQGGQGTKFPFAETKEAPFTLFSVCLCYNA